MNFWPELFAIPGGESKYHKVAVLAFSLLDDEKKRLVLDSVKQELMEGTDGQHDYDSHVC